MTLTRRKFLRATARAAVIAAVSAASLQKLFAQEGQPITFGPQKVDGLYQVPQEARRDRAFYFTQATFEPHLDTDFRVRAGVLVSTLRLVEVEACRSSDAADAKASGAGECFSLMFKADEELSRARTIHVFEHGALGEFSLFVSPTKRKSDPEGLYYVAVINHRIYSGAAPRTPR